MREIRFRAWDETTKKMWIWNRFYACYELEESGHMPFKNFYNKSGIYLMQYTGLKDKNGKEIYKGDILAYKTSDSCYSRFGEKYIVEYKEASFQCGYQFGDLHKFLLDFKKSEVIGNVYQNPELLKEN